MDHDLESQPAGGLLQSFFQRGDCDFREPTVSICQHELCVPTSLGDPFGGFLALDGFGLPSGAGGVDDAHGMSRPHGLTNGSCTRVLSDA